MGMNKAWHAANPMPPKATREQRLRWHVAHRRVCACRPVPADLRADVERRLAASVTARARKPD